MGRLDRRSREVRGLMDGLAWWKRIAVAFGTHNRRRFRGRFLSWLLKGRLERRRYPKRQRRQRRGLPINGLWP